MGSQRATSAQEAEPKEPGLVVKAIMVMDGGGAALVEKKGNEVAVHVVKSGDELSGGKVLEIKGKAVVWEKGGERKELTLLP